MTFAARPLLATGAFSTVGMAANFAATSSSPTGLIASFVWTLGTDGVISKTAQFAPVAPDTAPTSWGLPATVSGGSSWECSLAITSGSITHAGGGGAPQIYALGTTFTGAQTIGAQTTPWYALTSAQIIGAGFAEAGGSFSTCILNGTLSIRNKITQQVITATVALNMSS